METSSKMPGKSSSSQNVSSLQDIKKLLLLEEEASEPHYKSNSYEVASLMMYLTGVEKKIFENYIPDLSKKYQIFDKEHDARVIRNLCMVRTALLRNFLNITRGFLYEMKSLSTMPEYIPSESVFQLEEDGISLQTGKPDVNNYIKKINTEISNRINRVQSLFPDWVKWDYIRPLFIMPKASKVEGIKAAADFYNSDRNRYPYQVWLNWDQDDCGNIFSSDYKFISIIYAVNGDTFEDKSLISGTDTDTLIDLYEFIEQHEKVLIVVDCENSDPIKLAAALLSLSDSQVSTVYKIVFFDSANTTPAWETLCNTGITKEFETERNIVSTLYEYKSQVDMALAVNVTKEVYSNEVDAVILVSSDSDYWTLIKSIPDADFLVMLEKMKSGNTIRDTLNEHGYQYCFIDDFCTANSYQIKIDTILNSIQKQIDELVNFNVREMLDEEAKASWLALSKKEADNLYDRYLKKMKLKIQTDGEARIIIKD